MNKHTFFSRAKRTALLSCNLILIITAFLSATAYAQSSPEIDVSVSVHAYPLSITAATGEVIFDVHVPILRDRALRGVTATGVVIKIEIPDGAVPTALYSDSDKCNFTDNVLTCNLGEAWSGGIHPRRFHFKVKPAEGSQVITLTASITANEFDPNLSNNTFTGTFRTTPKSRKRVRFF